MGTLQAMEMAAQMPLHAALLWHLTDNHYPPVSAQFVEAAEWAVGRAVEAHRIEDESLWEEETVLPNGVSVSVAKIVDSLHLAPFIQYQIEQEDEDA